MVVMDEIENIKSFFQSHQVRLSTVWLESCVNWCKEENLPADYTIKDLQLKVYEQWLLLDLRDVEVPCLPPDLSNRKQYTLTGNYSLQMMQVIDISKPKHWQLQRIRNNVSKNADEQVESSRRTLLLTLTDGVQEIEAMEYKPIPCLNLNLAPGIKIRLAGPISIRRGRLMLRNHNVKVLGGEVDDLIIPNAAENVLAKLLNLPLNPKPQIIEETLLSANKDIFAETGATVNTNVPQSRNNLINRIQPPVGNMNNLQNQHSISSRANISISKPMKQNNLLDVSDEDTKIAAEIELLMEVEREFENPSAKRRKASRTPDLFDDMDFNDTDFANIDIPDTVIKTNNDGNKTPLIQKSSTPVNLDVSASLDHDNDIFENMDFETQLDRIEDKVKASPSPTKNLTPPKSVILTIEKLMKNIPNISNGKFKIKAKFKSVVEKLTVADDKFYLIIKVEDDSGDIAVKVHSEVVADLAEFSPLALLSLKSKVIENDAEAQRKVLETLKRLKDKLLKLNNVVEVQVNVREKFPIIVNIL